MKIFACEQAQKVDEFPIPGNKLLEQPDGVYELQERPEWRFIVLSRDEGDGGKIHIRLSRGELSLLVGSWTEPYSRFRRLPNARVCLEIRDN